jgi:hypothetical protein
MYKKSFFAILLLLTLPSVGLTAFSVGQGGTGTSTSPSLNDMLIGNGSGGYSFINRAALTGVAAGSEGSLQYNINGLIQADSDIVREGIGLILKSGNSLVVNLNQSNAYFFIDYVDGLYQAYLNSRLYDTEENVGIPLNIKGAEVNLEPGYVGHVSIKDRVSGKMAKFDVSNLDQDNMFTFPNTPGTFGLLEANQTWSGSNVFSKGQSATTTVTYGEIGDVTSRSCFNTKNTDGQDISFYFVGTSMIVENNICN